MIACKLVLRKTLVAVWHLALRFTKYSHITKGHLEEISYNKLATLTVDKDAIRCDIVKCGLYLSKLQQHRQKALD